MNKGHQIFKAQNCPLPSTGAQPLPAWVQIQGRHLKIHIKPANSPSPVTHLSVQPNPTPIISSSQHQREAGIALSKGEKERILLGFNFKSITKQVKCEWAKQKGLTDCWQCNYLDRGETLTAVFLHPGHAILQAHGVGSFHSMTKNSTNPHLYPCTQGNFPSPPLRFNHLNQGGKT